MTIKESWTLKFLAIIFLGFMIGNLLFLDYMLITGQMRDNTKVAAISSEDGIEQSYCDKENCVSEIYQTINQATQAAVSDEETYVENAVSAVQPAQEYFVSFGGGTNSTNQWSDVPGAAAYIDSSLYPNIATVTFEVGAYIPTGNQTAYIQLFNETAQHPVWFSEVSLSGGTPQFLVSNPITLDPGNNLYQVQMMSTLSYPTNLTDAKVRIQTN